MMKLISKNRPFFGWDDLRSILKIWEKGSVERFERQFAEFVRAPYALAFPYARSAIWIALLAWKDVRGGREVIIPAYTCTAVPYSIIQAGLVPRFVDINLETYMPDEGVMAGMVSSDTVAIMPVHTYGNIADMDGLAAQLKDQEVLILEDSALCPKPAFNSSLHGASASIYSFDYTKHLSTIEGGMVATHNQALYEKLKKIRDTKFSKTCIHSSIRNLIHFFIRLFFFGERAYPLLDFFRSVRTLERYYDERSLEKIALPEDFQSLLSPWQGRIGLAQLAKAREIFEKRKKISEFYYHALAGFRPDVIPQASSANSLWSHYPVRITGRNSKNIIEKMRKAGVEVGLTFNYSLPELGVLRTYKDREFPNSTRAAGEMINLPNYPSLSNRQIHHVIDALKKAVVS